MYEHIQSLCKCGHLESFHNGVRMFEDGKMPLTKNTGCRATSCDCSNFNFDKKICIYCLQEAQMSQYARSLRSDDSTIKAQEVLVCRNYPNCEKSEKDFHF